MANRAIRPQGTVTVEFTVAGAALEDPAECLRVVERKCGRRISLDGLFKREEVPYQTTHFARSARDRREWDRAYLAAWGDDRLAPLFPKDVDSYMRECWSGESVLVLPHDRSKLTCWIK